MIDSIQLQEMLRNHHNYVLLKEGNDEIGVLFDLHKQRHICLNLPLHDYKIFIGKFEQKGIKVIRDLDEVINENYCSPVLVWNEINGRYDYVEREHLDEYLTRHSSSPPEE